MMLSGCGLERDWAAFQAAFESDASSSTGDTSQTSTGTDTSGTDMDSDGSAGSTGSTGGENSAGEAPGTVEGGSGDDDATASSSSGGSTAFCGDGVVNQPGIEECDDGNFDEADRCAHTCQKIRLIFVTSLVFQGNINGLQSADAYCKSLALKAMMADPSSPITDPGNFKALLATSKEKGYTRHFPGKGPYHLVNGLRVSDSFDALFTEPHQNFIDVDERSMTHSNGVWTGMAADGESYPGINFCNDWTTTGQDGSSTHGYSDIAGMWLFAPVVGNPTTDCGDQFAIYCLEQE